MDFTLVAAVVGRLENVVRAARFVRDSLPHSAIVTLTAFSSQNPLRETGQYSLFLPVEDYGFAESGHAYYLHSLIDFYIWFRETVEEQHEE